MTNREYMQSLNNEELSHLLNVSPWENTASEKWYGGWSSWEEGIQEWLEQEHIEDY